jgi:hypothetical protein
MLAAVFLQPEPDAAMNSKQVLLIATFDRPFRIVHPSPFSILDANQARLKQGGDGLSSEGLLNHAGRHLGFPAAVRTVIIALSTMWI